MVSRGFRQILLSWFDPSAGMESSDERLIDLSRPVPVEQRESGFEGERGQ